jgi:hypothetical protein
MGAEFGTHFETALKTIWRENFFENFAILSGKLGAGEGTRTTTRNHPRASGPIVPRSHYKSPGYMPDRFCGFSLHP